jgi:hypothetical protein
MQKRIDHIPLNLYQNNENVAKAIENTAVGIISNTNVTPAFSILETTNKILLILQVRRFSENFIA